jgi:voltage-gated potassium channel
LRDAGVERAAALIAAAHDDATNLVVVLTARSINRELRIVARVNDPNWFDRISRAGADTVLSPYESYGAALAASAGDASVLGLHDLPALGLRAEEFTIAPGSSAVGTTLRDLAGAHPDVLVVGLRHDDGITRWHEVDGPLGDRDVIVALGEPAALRRFARMLTVAD